MPVKRNKISSWKLPPSGHGFDPATSGITQSLLGAYLHCPYKYVYAVNGWQPRAKKTTTVFGSMVHDILAEIYSSGGLTEDEIRKRIETWETEDAGVGVPASDRFKAFPVLCEYQRFYADDFKSMKFTGIEQEFDVDYRGIRLRGKRDGRFVDPQGKAWIMEHKTKGRISEDNMLKRLSFDLQSLFYLFTDRIEHGNEDCIGVYYNVIRNPQIKPKAEEKLFDYSKRLVEDIRSREDFYFIRYFVQFTKQDVEHFRMELDAILYELLEIHNSKRVPYHTRVQCELPFPCKYLDACASGVMTNYVQENLYRELEEEHGSGKEEDA